MSAAVSVSEITRLQRCEDEIAAALTAGQEKHTQMERLGILIWELDWRAEREFILLESGSLRPGQDEIGDS